MIRKVIFFNLSMLLSACGSDTAPPAGHSAFSCNDAGSAPAVKATFGLREITLAWSLTTKAGFRLEVDEGSGFVPLGDVPGTQCRVELPLPPLYSVDWNNTRYRVAACDDDGNCESTEGVEFRLTPADSISAIGELHYGDAMPSERFGLSMAVSAGGDTLAVGSPASEDVGGEAHVYVFALAEQGWSLTDDLVGSLEGGFGRAISLSADGQLLAVGAPGAGTVYLYVRGDNGWDLRETLTASNINDDNRFGWSLALSGPGDHLFVGAPAEKASYSGLVSGGVYWFSKGNDGWQQRGLLEASEPSLLFGEVVVVDRSGSRLAVAAPNEAGCAGDGQENCVHAGAVHIFERNDDAYVHTARIVAVEPAANHHFGRELVISGDGRTLAASVMFPGPGAGGRVHVFRDEPAGWHHEVELVAPNIEPWDGFGAGLAMDHAGDTLLVGATGDQGRGHGIGSDMHEKNAARGIGAVWAFERTDNWRSINYLKAPEAAVTGFGRAIAISADAQVVFISATRDASGTSDVATQDNNGHRGAVFMY